MIKFIFICVGFVIFLGFLLGFSVIRMFKRILFGSTQQENPKNRQQTRSNASSRTQQKPPRKKIIEKDEGEYVDFEEVK